MAHIHPFRAWRYNADLAQQLDQLISPPFDTVSRQQREALYQYPYNSIHLSVPDAAHPPAQAAHDLQYWKKSGILQQDPLLALYVYYQYFTLEAHHAYCRKGFICFIEAAYWEEQVVLRHEDTLSPSVQDRADLLQATQLNASPTHGLYTDPEHRLETYLDESMQHPVYEVEDYQGVRDVLSRITDPAVIQKFVQTLKDKPVILADGHHRYESSLIYRRAQEAQQTAGTGYKYHMMYLTNTESEDLRVLPTHRLVRIPSLSEAQMMQDLAYYFDITPVEEAADLPSLIAGKRWAFGLVWKEKSYQIILKEEVFEQFDRDLSPVVKALDTAVLHHFIIEKVLGITPTAQRGTSEMAYEQSFVQCQQQVAEGVFTLAIITNGVSMEQIKQVCYTGQVMPPKTTYFYPKAIAGFVFGSIKDEEL